MIAERCPLVEKVSCVTTHSLMLSNEDLTCELLLRLVWKTSSFLKRKPGRRAQETVTRNPNRKLWPLAFLEHDEIGIQEASKYFPSPAVADSCSHLAGFPPQISHAPSTPRLFNPPQEPEIGARPLMMPTAIMATIVIRMTKDRRNSVMCLPIQALLRLCEN